ncbi:MAG: hypothetical protein Q4Q07_08270 [Tissierellia bacterium]|nr:hypothetical protein [Tissierellia bacterium]
MKPLIKRIVIIFIGTILILGTLALCSNKDIIGDKNVDYKPVIYLYPEKTMDVKVELDYDGVLTHTYPKYEEGWFVKAHPDGRLINDKDGEEYSYLFWEGITNKDYDLKEGYVVKGEDTAKFLQKTLRKMGLEPKEYNEFIVFWLPHMEKNPYNLITFQGKEYRDRAKLIVEPKPDSELRVFMVFQALEKPINIPEPKMKPFERKGFTLVEWGGTEVKGFSPSK